MRCEYERLVVGPIVTLLAAALAASGMFASVAAVSIRVSSANGIDAAGCGVGGAAACRTINFAIAQLPPASGPNALELSGYFTDIGMIAPTALTIAAATTDPPSIAVLDGCGLGPGIRSNYSLTLLGLTFQRFTATYTGGGAVCFTPQVPNDRAVLHVADCRFINNTALPLSYSGNFFSPHALTGGGAILAMSGYTPPHGGVGPNLWMKVAIERSVFVGNTALGAGGAVYVRYSSVGTLATPFDTASMGVRITDSCFYRNFGSLLGMNSTTPFLPVELACNPATPPQSIPTLDFSSLPPLSIDIFGEGGAVSVRTEQPIKPAPNTAYPASSVEMVVIARTRFVQNLVYASMGGALAIYYINTPVQFVSHVIQNVAFVGNAAPFLVGMVGGAMYLQVPSPQNVNTTIVDTTCVNNVAWNGGGCLAASLINGAGSTLAAETVTYDVSESPVRFIGAGTANSWHLSGLAVINNRAGATQSPYFVDETGSDGGGLLFQFGAAFPEWTSQGDSFVLQNSIIQSNGAVNRGGGVTFDRNCVSDYASFVFQNVTFRENAAGTDGGGLAFASVIADPNGISDEMPALFDCTFLNNTSQFGGGLWWLYDAPTTNVNLTLTRSTFIGNRGLAEDGGGATIIFNGYVHAPPTGVFVSDCAFRSNSVRTNITDPELTVIPSGGGLSVEFDGTFSASPNNFDDPVLFLNVERCEFYRNSAILGGGGLSIVYPQTTLSTNDPNARFTVRHCNFTENTSIFLGGGLALTTASEVGTDIAIADCVFVRNTLIDNGDGWVTDIVSLDGNLPGDKISYGLRGGAAVALQAPSDAVTIRPVNSQCGLHFEQVCAGFYVYTQSTRIQRCIFDSNQALVAASSGGGLFISNMDAIVLNSVVANNYATAFGGGIRLVGVARLMLVLTDIAANDAGGGGSGTQIHSVSLGPVILVASRVLCSSLTFISVADSPAGSSFAGARQSATSIAIPSGGLVIALTVAEWWNSSYADPYNSWNPIYPSPALDGAGRAALVLQCDPGYTLSVSYASYLTGVTGEDAVGDDITYTFVSSSVDAHCTPCPVNTYTLGFGQLIGNFTADPSDQTILNPVCLSCPFGAQCLGANQIVSLPNYFGVASQQTSATSEDVTILPPQNPFQPFLRPRVTVDPASTQLNGVFYYSNESSASERVPPPVVTFSLCPIGTSCCPPNLSYEEICSDAGLDPNATARFLAIPIGSLPNCPNVNYCPYHRTGPLCSSCEDGYGETFGSTGCVLAADCGGRTAYGIGAGLGVTCLIAAVYLIYFPRGSSGTSQVLVYYFQSAALLFVDPTFFSGTTVLTQFQQMAAFLNFDLGSVGRSESDGGAGAGSGGVGFCVVPRMTAVTKLAANLSLPAVLLAIIAVVFVVHRIMRCAIPPKPVRELGAVTTPAVSASAAPAAAPIPAVIDSSPAPAVSAEPTASGVATADATAAPVSSIDQKHDVMNALNEPLIESPAKRRLANASAASLASGEAEEAAVIKKYCPAQWSATMAVFVSFTYTSLLQTLFSLLHCQPVNGLSGERLVDAIDIVCYTDWQSLLIVVLCVAIPAPLGLLYYRAIVQRRHVLAKASKNASKSATLTRSTGNGGLNQATTSVGSRTSVGPPVSSDDLPPSPSAVASATETWEGFRVLSSAFTERFWWWDNVVLLRRFLFVVLFTFITDNYVRPFTIALVALLFLIAHVHYRPFRHRRDQYLETFCLFALITLCVIMARCGALLNHGISPAQTALQIISTVLLVVPLLVPLWMVGRFLVGKLQSSFGCCKCCAPTPLPPSSVTALDASGGLIDSYQPPPSNLLTSSSLMSSAGSYKT